MNWREDGRKRSCLNLGYYSRIRLEVEEKDESSQLGQRSPGRDMSPGPVGYKPKSQIFDSDITVR
jgi:hypothetical protein